MSTNLHRLGRAMSEISEDCWCAGWLDGTERILPVLCRRAVETQQPQHWGQGEVTVEQAESLIELAEIAGSWAKWVDFDGDGNDLYEPFEEGGA